MSNLPLKAFPFVSKEHLRAYGMAPSAISSKSRPSQNEGSKARTTKGNLRKEKYDKASSSILAHLDLN